MEGCFRLWFEGPLFASCVESVADLTGARCNWNQVLERRWARSSLPLPIIYFIYLHKLYPTTALLKTSASHVCFMTGESCRQLSSMYSFGLRIVAERTVEESLLGSVNWTQHKMHKSLCFALSSLDCSGCLLLVLPEVTPIWRPGGIRRWKIFLLMYFMFVVFT